MQKILIDIYGGDLLVSNQRDYNKRPGRPRSKWNTVRTDKCDIRLTDDESYMLNRLATQYGETRSTILRKALYDFYIFNTEDSNDHS